MMKIPTFTHWESLSKDEKFGAVAIIDGEEHRYVPAQFLGPAQPECFMSSWQTMLSMNIFQTIFTKDPSRISLKVPGVVLLQDHWYRCTTLFHDELYFKYHNGMFYPGENCTFPAIFPDDFIKFVPVEIKDMNY